MKEHPKSFDILKNMALAQDSKVRGFTAFALSKFKELDDEGFELLIRLLKDREPEVWHEASSSMGGIASKNKKVYNYVMEIGNDDFYELRKRGTRTLGEIAKTDAQALGLLQLRIVDENKEVREEAIRVLGCVAKSKDEAFQILKNIIIHFPVSTSYGYDDVYTNAIKALSEAYETRDEISILEQLVGEKDKFIRIEAANAIGEAAKKNAKAFSLLKELAKHEDEYVRRGIAKSLKERD
jgi:HEAT repeat protein